MAVALIEIDVAPRERRLAEVPQQRPLAQRELREAVRVELDHRRVVDPLEQPLSFARFPTPSPGARSAALSSRTASLAAPSQPVELRSGDHAAAARIRSSRSCTCSSRDPRDPAVIVAAGCQQPARRPRRRARAGRRHSRAARRSTSDGRRSGHLRGARRAAGGDAPNENQIAAATPAPAAAPLVRRPGPSSCAAATFTTAAASRSTKSPRLPPAPIVEVVVVAPGPNYVWIGGRWVWRVAAGCGRRATGRPVPTHAPSWVQGHWVHRHRALDLGRRPLALRSRRAGR